jgi:hypothetical protein
MLSVVGGLLLISVVGLAHAAQTPSQPQCSLAGIGRFDVGWTEKADGGSYRCVPTFDEALKASGAAWIKVNADGTLGAMLLK